MTYIEMLSHTGVAVKTADSVGTQREKQYFRVIAENVGKLFFQSEEEYVLWANSGRPYRGVIEAGRPLRLRPGKRPPRMQSLGLDADEDMADDM